MGEVERQEADLGQLVRDVIDMVRHLGRYRNKRIEFIAQEVVGRGSIRRKSNRSC